MLSGSERPYLDLESCKSSVYDFLTSQNGLLTVFNKCHTCIQSFSPVCFESKPPGLYGCWWKNAHNLAETCRVLFVFVK